MQSSFNITLSLFLCFFLFACTAQDEFSGSDQLMLWYKQPAQEWNQALPLGNGRMGAMAYGGIETEKLQLNEESLWAGTRFESAPDDFYDNLKIIQKLVLDGEIIKADSLGRLLLTQKPTSFRSYEPLGNIYIHMSHDSINVQDYRRELMLNDGILRVTYKIDDTEFVREMLLSAEDDVLAIHLTSSKPRSISGKVSMDRWKDAKFRTHGDNQLHMDGQIIDLEDHPDDPNPGGSGPGGEHMKFAGRMVVQPTGGTLLATGESVVLNEANEATILFTAATDYNLNLMNFDRNINPGKKADSILSLARLKTWEQIKNDHIQEHRKLFDRVSFNLGQQVPDTIPTDVQLQSIKEGESQDLIEKYFQFGRYLLMSSSRYPGKLPANLQGVWSEYEWAPWEADYHLNINLQMNYWPADLCNLPGTMDPLVAWMNKLMESGCITAQELYRSDGWFSCLATNPFGRTTPSASTIDSQFDNGVLDPLAGAWMAITLWRHYEFNQEEAYLREVYPILKGAAEFVADILVEDDDGSMVIVPSTSPENQYIVPGKDKELRITKASTYHMSVARAIFDAVIKSSEILDKDQESRNRLISLKEKFPSYQVGQDGSLQEWTEDYEEPEPGHRHLSHLLGFHPFALITSEQPDLYKAVDNALAQRVENGGGAGGWSRAHLANCYAWLGKGDQALYFIHGLLANNSWDNLFNGTSIFQIDGNFGGTTGIAEMVLQSHLKDQEGNYIVHLLPALPSSWTKGEIRGLRARGGYLVDMVWENGNLVSAEIKPEKEGMLKLMYKDKFYQFNTEPGKIISFEGE